MKTQNNTITLYNDYDITTEQLADWLDKPADQITDSDWQLFYDCQAEDLDNTLEDLDHYPAYIISANVGRWNGRFEAYKIIDTLKDLYKFLEDSTKITLDTTTGTLQITTAHHDSTNYLTIKPLSTRGCTYRDNHYFDSINVEKKIATTRGLTTKFKI